MTTWINDPVKTLDENARAAAVARQAQLTKPPGALGQLETIATTLAAMQGTATPRINHIHMTVFAADHGVTREGVSAFPQEVTLEMVKNFSRGGAAINVLANALNASLDVVNLGTVATTEDVLNGVINQTIAPCSGNIAKEQAMDSIQLAQALTAGKDAIKRAQDHNAQLFIAGDMGIGNTTPSTALICKLTGLSPQQVAGPGTGLSQQGVTHKVAVLEQALACHTEANSPIDILQCLGGFEIAALTGAYLHAAQVGLPVLVDGFIASAAALVAIQHNPDCQQWMFFSHASAEPGHQHLMNAIQTTPLLNLGLRLGEGSGAAIAAPLLQLACQLHNEMATFEEAAVSGKLS